MPLDPLLPAFAYARVLPRLRAVAPADHRPLSLAPVAAAQAVRRALPTLRAARDRLAALPGFDLESLDDLEDLALAIVHLEVERRARPAWAAPRAALRAELEATIRLQKLEIAPLVTRGLLPRGFFPARPPWRASLFDLANLLVGLTDRLADAWPTLAGRSSFTREAIADAAALARKAIASVAHDALPDHEARRLDDERSAAFSLLLRDYEAARLGYLYLVGGRPAAMEAVPSLHTHGVGRRKRKHAKRVGSPADVAPSEAPGEKKRGPGNRRLGWSMGIRDHDGHLIERGPIPMSNPIKSKDRAKPVSTPRPAKASAKKPSRAAGNGRAVRVPARPVATRPAPIVNPCDVQTSGYRGAYDRQKPAIDRVDATSVPPITFDPAVLFRVMTLTADSIRTYEADIRKACGTVDVDDLLTLDERRDAFMHTQIILNQVSTTASEYQSMCTQAIEVRRDLVGAADILARHGLFQNSRLPELRAAGSGTDVAIDIMSLVSALRTIGDTIRRTPLGADDLENADQLARDIMNVAAYRSTKPAEMVAATEQRLRAYGALLPVLTNAQRVIRYLRGPFGDADALAPSIFAGRGGGTKADDAPPPAGASTTTPPSTPAAPSASAPVAAPVLAQPTFAPVPIGHPGGNPFAS